MGCNDVPQKPLQTKTAKRGERAVLWLGAISVAYLYAQKIVRAYGVFSALLAGRVAEGTVEVEFPNKVESYVETVLYCFVLALWVYLFLGKVCQEEWVQETVNVKKCWKKIKWYNPWSWVKSIVCTFVEVVKWVLKVFCKNRWLAVAILFLSCIAVQIVIVVVW